MVISLAILEFLNFQVGAGISFDLPSLLDDFVSPELLINVFVAIEKLKGKGS